MTPLPTWRYSRASRTKLASKRSWKPRARSSACNARSSALFLRKHLLEGAHGHAFVDPAAVEGIGGNQGLGFLACRAIDDDQRTGARPVGRALERPAKHDLFFVKIQKLDVICPVGITQARGVWTVETNDGVH